MRVWKTGGVLFFVLLAASCGGNGTTPSVTISPTSTPVIVNGTQLFTASVAGATTTTVTWNICLPPPKSGDLPVNCGVNTLGTIVPIAGSNSATYIAPTAVPNPSTFDVVAFSNQNDLYFGVAQVTVTTGIGVNLAPLSATLDELQSITFTATVTGSTNKAVSWAINGNTVSGGNQQLGTIIPTSNNTAVYTAPGSIPADTITVSASSVADPSVSASATVSIEAPANPTATSLSPSVAAEGSIQQDVYVNGSGFTSLDTVYAGSGVAQAPVTTFFISTTLLRATIPSSFFQQPGFLQLQVQRPVGIVSQPLNLTVQPVRPSLIASTPTSTYTNVGAVNVNLTGGYYVQGRTQAMFNGLTSANGVTTSCYPANNCPTSRQLTVTIPANSLGTAGLYPLFLQNPDVPAGLPATASTNLAVEPSPSNIPTSQIATVGVGATPAAVAIDQALGIALVANSGDGSVSVIDLATNTVTRTIAGVATQPTGIAIDDMLSPNVAVVVDTAQNSVVPINLSTFAVSPAVTLPINSTVPTPPVSIGINPVSHRGLVAYPAPANLAVILDISIVNGSPTVSVAQQAGSGFTGYSTGDHPVVAIDPDLNWAVVAPGGSGGSINFVDLGSAVNALYPSGRSAKVVGTLVLSSPSLPLGATPTGVGINPVMHTAVFTDPNSTTAWLVSLLNNSVSQISFQQSGTGYIAAGASLTSNVGVVVNQNSNTAAILDLSTGFTLQANVAVGNLPKAVAVDPATNKAVVVNQGDGTASILSLGPIRSLHITEASPTLTLTSTTPLQLTLNGSGFVAGTSQVLLDNTAIPAGDVDVVNSRQIVATIPASNLAAVRRYSVSVENPGGGTNLQSNEVDLAVLQAVSVGQAPVGVAVDPAADAAVVSNYVDGTASVVDLVHGIVTSTVPTGSNPLGVAVLPRLGLALVANSSSNNATVVDETGVIAPTTFPICAGSCPEPTGVGINGDSGTGAIANSGQCNPGTSSAAYCYSFVDLSLTSPTASTGGVPLDNGPVAVAFDPNLNYAAITTTVGTATTPPGLVDIIDFATDQEAAAVPNFVDPTGVVFDPLNQVFLVADRGANNVDIVDPATFIPTPIRAGIDPASLDYNFQTSTLVTANNASDSISLFDYLCPPNGVNPVCTGPLVRRVIGLADSQQSSLAVDSLFSVAVDPKLNLLVLADQQNNRVLLVPLP